MLREGKDKCGGGGGWKTPPSLPAALSGQHARTLPAPLVASLYRPLPRAAFLALGPLFPAPPAPLSPVLDLPGSQAQSTSWLSPSFGQWYRGETEAPGTETSSVAPSQLQGGEGDPAATPPGTSGQPDSPQLLTGPAVLSMNIFVWGLSCPRGLTLESVCSWMCDLKGPGSLLPCPPPWLFS